MKRKHIFSAEPELALGIALTLSAAFAWAQGAELVWLCRQAGGNNG